MISKVLSTWKEDNFLKPLFHTTSQCKLKVICSLWQFQNGVHTFYWLAIQFCNVKIEWSFLEINHHVFSFWNVYLKKRPSTPAEEVFNNRTMALLIVLQQTDGECLLHTGGSFYVLYCCDTDRCTVCTEVETGVKSITKHKTIQRENITHYTETP